MNSTATDLVGLHVAYADKYFQLCTTDRNT